MSKITIIFRAKLLIMIAFVVSTLIACSKDTPTNVVDNSKLNTTFAIMSDPHYFAPSLGIGGVAFEKYLANDRKMLAESKAISESVVESLLQENIKFVLVSGDLTKDGEKQSHIELAKLYGKLVSAGKKVIVVPGNHDISNPHSHKYTGESAEPTPSVTPEEFAEIYKDCGFGSAIARDKNSLSYISEPVAGLWVFALDACRYKENTNSPITGGKYSEATLQWINDNLQKAKEQNKTVIGIQHHGLVEHFNGQKQNPISMDYVIDDWQNVSKQFIDGNMKAIFTGHFHANDVTKYSVDGKEIYDVETGSLITSPCPYRIASITNSNLQITTSLIKSINYDTKGLEFQAYAASFLKDNQFVKLISAMMTSQFDIDEASAATLTPIVLQALLDHYKGDEVMPNTTKVVLEEIQKLQGIGPQFIVFALTSLYTDLPPGDNNVNIIFNNNIVAKESQVKLKVN